MRGKKRQTGVREKGKIRWEERDMGERTIREERERGRERENGISYWKLVPLSFMPTERKKSSSTFWSCSVGLPKPWPPIETDNRNGEKQGSERKKWQIKDSQVGVRVGGGFNCAPNTGMKTNGDGGVWSRGVSVCVYSGDLGQGECNWGAQREEHNTTMHETLDMSSSYAQRTQLQWPSYFSQPHSLLF